MKCKHIKDGQECKANALLNGEYCFYHDPKTKEQVREAGKRGGKVSFYDKGLIRAEPIDMTQDNKAIIYLLIDTINRVRQVNYDGSLNVKIANCIGQLAGKILEAQRELALTERLDNLEKRLIKEGVLK